MKMSYFFVNNAYSQMSTDVKKIEKLFIIYLKRERIYFQNQ